MSGNRPAPGENVAICAFDGCSNAVDLNYDDHEVLPNDEVACLDETHWPVAGESTSAAVADLLDALVAQQGVTVDEAEYHLHQARLVEPGDAHDDGLAR